MESAMKLHEFQAKDFLSKSGIPIPRGQLVTDSDQASKVPQIIDGPPWVIKAQVHTGGRGKAGGIKIAHYPYEVVTATESLLGKSLMTKQTGPEGVIVHQVLIEKGVEIEKEYYLSVLVDRSTARPTMIFSQAGGMDIEEVAEQSPELILQEPIDPATGWMPFQARNLIYRTNPIPSPITIRSLMSVMSNVYKVFTTLDCSLIEINPLVTTGEGKVLALDAKISIDDNALFRQKELLELDDPKGKDPLELMAEKYHLSYIRLNGNIGAMVNGAGLAMATMDLIKRAGAEPANFLDVGGGASEEMITKGFEIILKDKRVKAVLINIFGGILRCDVLARGVLAAATKQDIKVPLIVRLEGTNVKEGRSILENSDLKFLVARDLSEAAGLVTKQVKN
jgi:succinyl-CoA synthetase beta subunit